MVRNTFSRRSQNVLAQQRHSSAFRGARPSRPPEPTICGAAQESGRQIVRMIVKGITARRIINQESIENTIRLHAAVGGSTNAILMEKTKTLPIAVYNVVSDVEVDWGSVIAAAVAIMTPTSILTMNFPKYVIKGLRRDSEMTYNRRSA